MTDKHRNFSLGIWLVLAFLSVAALVVASFCGLSKANAGRSNLYVLGQFSYPLQVSQHLGPPETEASHPPVTPAGSSAQIHEEPPTTRVQSDELGNNSCLDCHNPDILKMSPKDLLDYVSDPDGSAPPKKRQPFVMGELNLSINQKRYLEGSHADTTCVSCHNDIAELPHQQRLRKVDCKECHEESVATLEASVHGARPDRKSPECIGCHDVHYGHSTERKSSDFQRKLCIDCHRAFKRDDIEKSHAALYLPRLHLALDCMFCHRGKQPGVHYIPSTRTKLAACDSCHQKTTALSADKTQAITLAEYVLQTGFINAKVLKQFGYVTGAHRIPILDAVVILAVLAPLGLPMVHGGLRFLTRRRELVKLSGERVLLHPLLERLWHWFQAACIIMLIVTGMMLHWPESFPGWFQWAVRMHNWFGIAFLSSFVFWLGYNLLSGRISHYLPKKGEIPKGMVVQAQFYGYGIFKHQHHPFQPKEDNKFNPLQKVTYLFKQLILVPVLLVSGLLYMYPDMFGGLINALGGLAVLGTFHFALGGMFASFLVAHIYLATTGETIGENFRSMITGWGIKMESHQPNEEAVSDQVTKSSLK